MNTTTESPTLRSCTDLVSKLEHAVDRQTSTEFQMLAEFSREISESLSAVSRATFTHLRSDTEDVEPGPGVTEAVGPRIVARQSISGRSQIQVCLWCNPTLDAHDQHCIQETASAIVRLAAEAILRHRMTRVERFSDDIHSFVVEASELPADQRWHRCAEWIARIASFDRVSLFRRRGRRLTLLASSVQANIDRKASRVASLEETANWFSKRRRERREWVIHREDSERPADCFETGVCVSMTARWSAQDIMIMGESESQRDSERESIAIPAQWTAVEGVFARLLETDTTWKRTKTRFHPVARRCSIAIMILAALWLYPMTIQIPAHGRLTPVLQESLYAPERGVITSVRFQRGQRVQAGEPLIELASPELSLREAEILGALMAAQEQLAVSVARRGEESKTASREDRRVIEVRINSLKKQLEIVRQRQHELTILSPIDGIATMVTHNESETLAAGRPVRTGDKLARVLQPESGYEVQLDIDDSDAGYVVRAHASSDTPLRCVFRRNLDPTSTYQATMSQLADSIHVTDAGDRVLKATLKPDLDLPNGLSESGVVGWIKSESAPSGYVLFRKVVQTLRMKGWM